MTRQKLHIQYLSPKGISRTTTVPVSQGTTMVANLTKANCPIVHAHVK